MTPPCPFCEAHGVDMAHVMRCATAAEEILQTPAVRRALRADALVVRWAVDADAVVTP